MAPPPPAPAELLGRRGGSYRAAARLTIALASTPVSAP